ncbi:MAG: glycosyltransferase family 2 protein [bacterium]
MEKPDISIIIISYNTRQITKNCLDSIIKSLKNTDLKYQIIVVDNNSKDSSPTLLNSYLKKYPTVFKIILNKENSGFGKANNQGVKIANSDYLLLLNSDTVTLNNSVEKLLNYYKKNENIVNFAGAKLFNKDMSKQSSAAPFFSLPVVFAALFLRGDYWGLTRSSPNVIKKVDWVSGACILTSKENYQKVNGFDESVFMYMDEVDLLYRAKRQGLNTYFYPNAKFIHIGFASSGSKSYPVVQVFKGLIFFYKKHCSKWAFLWLLIMLKLKAKVSLLIGKATKNNYLIETYEKALEMVTIV